MKSVENILRYLRGQRSDTRDGNSMAQRDLMEELSQKFPQLANDIFDSLDDQSLANCQRVNRPWANYLGNQQRFQSANSKTRAIIWRNLCGLYLRGLFAMLGHEAV